MRIILDYDEMTGYVEHDSVDGSKPSCIKETFVINDEHLIDVHEYYTQQAIKAASTAAVDPNIREEDGQALAHAS